jgi:1,4-dihydroxy-6-naphthoate synthase
LGAEFAEDGGGEEAGVARGGGGEESQEGVEGVVLEVFEAEDAEGGEPGGDVGAEGPGEEVGEGDVGRAGEGEVAAGLLIHEGQLTYQDEGLKKIVDLGEWWSERTGGMPLPLGGNVIRKDLGPEMIGKISRMLHDSIAYGLAHRPEALDHALQYGRGLDRSKADRFVGMYVNDLTLQYGERGRAAVQRLMDEAWAKRLIPTPVTVEFSS